MNKLTSRQILILKRIRNVGSAKIIPLTRQNPELFDFDSTSGIIEIIRLKAPTLADKLSGQIIEQAIKEADEIISSCESMGVEIIGYCDENYPSNFKSIKDSDAPVILYCKGDSTLLNSSKMAAVIGTRKISDQGVMAGRIVTEDLVRNGFVIVSGLAVGCDTIGHQECLNNGGKTIAILGHGFDLIYPEENIGLSERIEQEGCLITEYPPYKKFNRNFFVARDRLQSALSNGVIVIETNIKGGTLHTVNFAIDHERPVACIDYKNSLDLPQNAGNRKLIAENKAFALTSTNLSEFISLMSKDSNYGEQSQLNF